MRRSPAHRISAGTDGWFVAPFSIPGLGASIGAGLRQLADSLRLAAGDGRVQLAAGLLGLALLAFVGVVHAPVFVDEADHVLGACLIGRGSLIYRDFFSHHFPLPYYALAALGEPLACSVLAGRVLVIASLLAATGLFAWAARNALAPLALVLLALAAPTYYLQLYLAEAFIAVGVVLVLATLTGHGQRLRGPKGQTLRFAGFAILSSSSPLGLMMALLLLPLVILGARRPHAQTAVACAAGLLLWPAILAVQGTLPAFVEQGIRFNTEIYAQFLPVQLTNPLALLWESLAFVRHRFSFAMDWLIGQDTKATPANFAVAFELLLVVLLGAVLLVRREERLFRLGVLLLAPLTLAREGFHLSPFVALACFGSVHLLAPVVRQSGRLQLLTAMLALVALRLYFFALPLQPGAESELAESLRPEAQVVRASAPSDPILYLPIAPQGYLADERRPGSFYTHFLPWQAAIPGAEDRVIADVEQNRVAVIVVDQETRIWDQYRFSEYAPRLHAHILASYRPLDQRDSKRARIFVRDAPWP